MEARRRGIPVVKRAQALAWLMEGKRGIAICGTHGKTTTTSMVSRVLLDAGRDPTFLVGGELNDLGSNARHGAGEFLVCEADESDGSLLLSASRNSGHHQPGTGSPQPLPPRERRGGRVPAVHRRTPPHGRLVYCGRGSTAGPVGGGRPLPDLQLRVGAVADYQAREVSLHHGGSRFEVWREGHRLAAVEPRGAGAAQRPQRAGLLRQCLRKWECRRRRIAGTCGVSGARCGASSERGAPGVNVVDDYAHHPTELKVTLRAARRVSGRG